MAAPDPSSATDLLPLLPAAFLLLLRSLAMAADAAIVTVGAERAKEMAAESRGGRALEKLKVDTDLTVATVRAFVSLCLAVAAVLAAWSAVSLSELLPSPPSAMLAALAGALVAWLVSTTGDIVLRSLAAHRTEEWARNTAWPVLALRSLFAPPTKLVAAAAELLLKPFGVRATFGLPPPPLEEIQRILSTTTDEGAPEPALVRSLFEFGDRTVKEIMVPRTDVQAIPHDAKPDEIVRLLLEEGHTRMPVYKGALDTIVGLVHVKDVLPLIANPELIIMHDLIRPTIFVPWNRPIQKVMRELQRSRQHFAVVVDEYGGVAGIITLEDIIEQIIGDIRDEFDDEEKEVVASLDGATVVKAEMRVADFNETFRADVPTEEGFETIGGFLNNLAGAIPAEGDRFYHGGFEFQVVKRDPRRVVEVRVIRTRGGADTPPPQPRV